MKTMEKKSHNYIMIGYNACYRIETLERLAIGNILEGTVYSLWWGYRNINFTCVYARLLTSHVFYVYIENKTMLCLFQ